MNSRGRRDKNEISMEGVQALQWEEDGRLVEVEDDALESRQRRRKSGEEDE
jgi:hypothetical protein